MLRVALMSLGCRANQAELSGIRNRLRALAGDLEVVSWDDAADVYLLNGCTVTSRADRQGRRRIHQARRRGDGAPVVVCGCLAESEASALASMPGVAAVVGNARKDDAAAIAIDLGRRFRRRRDPAPARVVRERIERSTAVSCPASGGDPGRVRAPLKVQEGCDRRCAYCVVPLVRGPERSVAAGDVLAQARTLADAGHPEIVITGIHTGRWSGEGGSEGSLPDLLRLLLRRVPGPRFRVSSLDPDEVSPSLIELMREEPRLCRHLHLSIQHLCPTVLRAMGRPSDPRRVLDLLHTLEDRIEGVTIGADVIAGFPGEDERSFEILREGLAGSPLAYLHVFGFSRRPGTAAWSMARQVPRAVVAARVRVLRELSEQSLRPRSLDVLRGRELEVVVERSAGATLRGTSSEYAAVELSGDPALVGRMVRVTALGRRGDVVLAEVAGSGGGAGPDRLTS